jgi:NAD(P)-dependent dehydrogenase (short-subunit alcohol dehydrogenase family)
MGMLEGDTALITGAASGIGRGIAKALVAEGVRIVLSDFAVEAGRALARELNATFIAADLADPKAARKLFDAAEKSLGSVSILVHSASPKRRENETALTATETEWDLMVTVGLRRIRARSSCRGTNAGAQYQGAHAFYYFPACTHATQPTALQRDESRSNNARKRTCPRPRSRWHSGQRYSTRRYSGRWLRRRYNNARENDSTGPNRNAGRHCRHGGGSPMRSFFSLCHGDDGCSGRWAVTL